MLTPTKMTANTLMQRGKFLTACINSTSTENLSPNKKLEMPRILQHVFESNYRGFPKLDSIIKYVHRI